MQIYPVGSRPSQRASPDYFAGTVWQDLITMAPEPARLNALIVHFEPSARTAWHTHPLGQTLHITQGSGLICKRGENHKKSKQETACGFQPMSNIGMEQDQQHT